MLDYNGNLVDAVVLGGMASLRVFRKPEISLSIRVNDDDGDDGGGGSGGGNSMDVKIYTSDEKEPLPLALHHTPLAVTVYIMLNSKLNSGGGTDGGW